MPFKWWASSIKIEDINIDAIIKCPRCGGELLARNEDLEYSSAFGAHVPEHDLIGCEGWKCGGSFANAPIIAWRPH